MPSVELDAEAGEALCDINKSCASIKLGWGGHVPLALPLGVAAHRDCTRVRG